MTGKKKKFYAVACGEKPGIYDTWYGPSGAEVQVRGFPNAQYRAFFDPGAAREWLKEFQSLPATKTEASSSIQTHRQAAPENPENPGNPPNPAAPTDKIESNAKTKNHFVVIYTDGGCKHNPGPGGYGVVLLSDRKRKELSAGFRHTTNNRMELLACIEGLKALKHPCSVTLYSDSQYVVNGIQKGWAKRWRKNNWMRNQTDPAENADLWAQLLDLCENHHVEFRWVKGHAGTPENERCDQLATEAAVNTDKLKEDTAFESGQTTFSNRQTLF